MLASVLLRLARIYGDDELERRAVGVFRLVHDAARPRAAGVRPCALRARPPLLAAARAGDRRPGRQRGRAAALAPFEPTRVVAVGPADGVPLLEGKELVDGQPAVYVCENFACRAPVTDADNLSGALTNP